jgi:haloalkane dehalogenase
MPSEGRKAERDDSAFGARRIGKLAAPFVDLVVRALGGPRHVLTLRDRAKILELLPFHPGSLNRSDADLALSYARRIAVDITAGHELFPFESRFVDIGGCNVHYVDEGVGTTLLFLHGNPTWSFLYRNIIASLRPRFRCVALDYPGFGRSKARSGYQFTPAEHADVVAGFVRALDLRGIVLMVQDWGGPIGFDVATRERERFAGFVVGNTFAWPVNDDPHFARFSQLLGGPLGRFMILNFNVFVNVLLPAGVKRRKLSRAEMNAYRAPFRERAARWPTYVFPREILGSHAFLSRVESGLPNIADLPALIVWGDADFAFRERERSRFEQLFRTHRTVMLPGAGHFIQEDAPDEIAQAISAWIPPSQTAP